ncbi:MAG: hemolysin III family protein [Firmicutes bacterium]|nr:hemolysin III family protein [Bacillota bacterium]
MNDNFENKLVEEEDLLVNSKNIEKTLKKKSSQNQIEYSKSEERFNIISHIVGAVFAVVGATVNLVRVFIGTSRGQFNFPALAIFSIILYGIGLFSLFLMSALYHAQPLGSTRRVVFRRFDHCMIAVLIAATYAPYMLIGMLQSSRSDIIWGIVIASVVLGMAVLVVVFNAINPQKFRKFCLVAYVIMGWAALVRIDRVFVVLGPWAFALLLAGGIAYTVGIIFYKRKSLKFNHGIWHCFVILGAALQFMSINLSVL